MVLQYGMSQLGRLLLARFEVFISTAYGYMKENTRQRIWHGMEYLGSLKLIGSCTI